MSRHFACATCMLLALGAWTMTARAATVSHAATSTSNEIEIHNFMFMPKTLTVPVGAKVMWINRDEDPHTVVSSNGQFVPSMALDTNERYVTTFSKPGTYVYYCTVHPFMTGTVIVK